MSSRSYGGLIVGMAICALCAPVAAQFPVTGVHDGKPGMGAGQVGGELYAGESDDIGPQVALATPPARVHVEVSGDMQLYHTSNMFLTEDSSNPNVIEQGSEVLLTSVDLAVAPDPVALGEGDFQPRLGYRQQWYVFSHKADPFSVPFGTSRNLDFYAQTLFMESRYRYHGHWLFAGGVDWTRLSFAHGDSNFYSEVVPRWSVQRRFALDDARLFVVGYQGAYHATTAESQSGEPSARNDRIDQGLFVNYTQSITPKLFVQPYYQYKYTRFPHAYVNFSETSRHDNLHTVGATVSYYFVPEISLRAFANYDVNDSSAEEFSYAQIYDYKKLDAGLGLNMNYRF